MTREGLFQGTRDLRLNEKANFGCSGKNRMIVAASLRNRKKF
jgi:hypothetical protein